MNWILFLCVFSGAIGGCLYHLYWLISLADSAKGKTIDSNSADGIFRVKVMLLKAVSGCLAGAAIWAWFYETQTFPFNQLAVISFIAGLSGEGFLGLIKRLSGVKNI